MSRRHFGSIKKISLNLPNLIEVQTNSYEWFFREGIQELLDEINPVEDFTGKILKLEFIGTNLDQPRFNEETTREKNLTFQAPLRCNVKLTNKMTGKSKESTVFLAVLTEFLLLVQTE